MRTYLVVAAVIALALTIGGTASAVTTQSFKLTRCLNGSDPQTFAAGSDIVATISWNTLALDQLQNFINNQALESGVITGPFNPVGNRIFDHGNFVWGAPYQATVQRQLQNGTLKTYTVWRSDLSVNFGSFTPGTYNLIAMTAAVTHSTNDGLPGGSINASAKNPYEWLITTNCVFTVQ